MSYENLAIKYRPRNLEEVMGQAAIKTTLANSVKLGRLAHAYVFYGPRGCGKTTIARILAKTLNCLDARNGKPCDKCASCSEIAESKSMDVLEIDAASHTDVDNVRNVIIDNVGLAPSRDKYKIYILDEVHMLSKQSFNALLKTIEEPPAHVVFIMATTDQTKVPVTILSRSQCFRFRPIPEDLIIERLRDVVTKENLKVSDEALTVIAASAGGAMRDALTLLDRAASFGKGSVELGVLNELLGHASPDLIKEVALALIKRDAAALYSGFEKIAREGYDPVTILRDLRNTLSETFLHLQGFSKVPTALALSAMDCPPITLARLSRKLNVVIDEVKFSDSPALASEIALFTLVETPRDLDALVKRLEALEGRLSSGIPNTGAGAVTKAAPGGGAGSQTTAPGAYQPEAGGEADGQKKNEKLPSSALWKRLLGVISVNKPILYNILLSVRVVFDQENTWKLSSASKFEADIIEKARKELEGNLERLAGRAIGLTVGHNEDAKAAPVQEEDTEQVLESAEVLEAEDTEADAGIAPEADLPAAPHPPANTVEGGKPLQQSPLASQPAVEMRWEDMGARTPEEEPELKHLNKVFHGRITRIQKIKGQ
ncbi:MAG: DNA polymerase III, subunit gamma and tau [Elusimicrobia bacterium RIFOXYA12_FULL_51_18]|nr:MAG: DNA polymerase III, subunit gamma and tau [Elusimicrobia bacterium RIFOXYA12_FULL_51_18]OGS32507.1 MAG: DNA polymerase III, subunit gamma and tau [Elusimicrobia bacterium RIFOXYA2_FULL_53_38]